MAESRDTYERIMALGQEEQGLIALQDTERLGSVLRERETAISVFLASDMGEQDSMFLEKLKSIQEMNSHLRLHLFVSNRKTAAWSTEKA